MINKEEYWANRKAGLRGQGEYPPKYGKQITEGDNAEYKIELPSGSIVHKTREELLKMGKEV